MSLPATPATNWVTGWWLDCAPKSLIVISGSNLYFEVTLTHLENTSGVYVGLSQASPVAPSSLFDFAAESTTTPQSGMAGTIGFTFVSGGKEGLSQGRGYPTNPTLGGSLQAAPTSGDTMAFAISTSSRQMWVQDVTAESGWYGGSDGGTGDPVAGLNGSNFSSAGDSPILGPFQFLFGCFNNSGGYGWGTINFGATSFVGALPAGYQAVDVTGGSILNSSDNSNLNIVGGLQFNSQGVTISGSNNPINGVRANATKGS